MLLNVCWCGVPQSQMVRDALDHYGNNDSCTAYTYGEDEGDMLRRGPKRAIRVKILGELMHSLVSPEDGPENHLGLHTESVCK